MTSPDIAEHAVEPRSAAATAQGMLTLHVAVGARRDAPDDRHTLVTVSQALDLTETVTVTVTGLVRPGTVPLDPADIVTGLTVTGRDAAASRPVGPVTDPDALAAAPAVRGVLALVDRYVRVAPGSVVPQVRVHVDRTVPVAGGLGGAAADTAAALTAMREILHGAGAAEEGFSLVPRPSDAGLQELAVPLGTGVPAALVGGTVLGTGTGTDLVPVMSRGPRHWALATDDRDLVAAEVFARLDEQRAAARRGERPDVRAGDATAVQRALLTGNPTELAEVLGNDLQAAALSLRPELRRTLTVAREAGALAAVVSGTGPTVAMLCSDRDHAVDVATAVAVAGHTGPTLVAASSPHGARPVHR